MQNEYLQQVMDNKAEVEHALRSKRRMSGLAEPAQAAFADAEEGSPAVDVRVTGLLWWRNVIVPPNAFVVHTRRGRQEPVDIGLGISFRYVPRTDAFLVVPAAMQTIVINANCICRERQGIMVQAYVQWVIDDFAKAYRRLDFSDPVDPMKVVNVQLREQAEATIKDTVASMGIDAVLADKQPIIEELTRRLRTVAEGGDGDEGLGLRIVTVQIKEAVISSARLWDTLQKGYRAEQRKIARVSELEAESAIRAREDESAREAAEQEIAREAAVARLRSEAEAAAFDRKVQESARRAAVEAELAAQRAEQERAVIEAETAIARLRAQAELDEARVRFEARATEAEREIALDARRQAVANDISPAQVRARLIEQMPAIAKHLPNPEKLTSINLGGQDALGSTLRALLSLVESDSPG